MLELSDIGASQVRPSRLSDTSQGGHMRDATLISLSAFGFANCYSACSLRRKGALSTATLFVPPPDLHKDGVSCGQTDYDVVVRHLVGDDFSPAVNRK